MYVLINMQTSYYVVDFDNFVIKHINLFSFLDLFRAYQHLDRLQK